MMMRISSREIDELAAAWVARIDCGLLSTDTMQELQSWLDADDRHLGAFTRARAIFLHYDRARALGDSYDPSNFSTRQPSAWHLTRRRFLLGGGGALAACVGLAIFEFKFEGFRYSTKKGEVQLVPLADGSAVTLDTSSSVLVNYTKLRRHVLLTQGTALFDVATDANRPFVVDANDLSIQAIGTRFEVRKLAEKVVDVLVHEGVVEVALPSNRGFRGQPTSIRVSALERVTAGPSTVSLTAVPIMRDVAEREMAWRQGMLSFDGEALAEAVTQFTRYSDTQIVIDDSKLAESAVTGTFAANNPRGFAKAIALSFGAQIYVEGNTVHLRS